MSSLSGEDVYSERTSSRKTCQKAQPSVEENGLYNGYDDDDDDLSLDNISLE